MKLAQGRGADRRAGARAGEGRQGGRLVRRRPPRDRSPRRESADRDDLSARQPQRRRDEAHPATTTSSSPCTRIPDGMQLVAELVHEGQGHAAAQHEHSAALQQVRGPRRQPRLVHVEPEPRRRTSTTSCSGSGIRSDHVQPSPDRSRRHGDVLAAVPRSVQLQLRSHDRRWGSTWSARRCTSASSRRASRASRCARARATRRGGTAVCARSATSRASSAFSRRRSATRRRSAFRSSPTQQLPRGDLPAPIAPQRVALPPVDRLLGDGELRDLRSRVALSRDVPVQQVSAWRSTPSRRAAAISWTISGKRIAAAEAALTGGATQAGAPAGGRGGRGGRGGAAAALARRSAGGAVGDPAAPFGRGATSTRRCTRTTTCSTRRTSAIRAATSFRPISRTSSRRSKFVNTLRHVGVYVDQATAPFTVARQAVSGRLVRDQDEPGGARAGARHDGAAGSPERLRVSGRSAASSVRQRRLDARVRDGRASSTACSTAFDVPIRSRFEGTSWRSRWRARSRTRSGAAGLPDVARGERRVDGDQPRVQGGRRGVLAQVAGDGERQDVSGGHVLHRAPSVAAGAAEVGGGPRRELRRARRRARPTRSSSRAKRIALVRSVRRLDAVRLDALTSSRSSRFLIRSCTRRTSTPAISRASSTCSILPSGARFGGGGAAAVAAVAAAVAGRGGDRSRPSIRRCSAASTPETTLPAAQAVPERRRHDRQRSARRRRSATQLGLPIENQLVVRAPGEPDRALPARSTTCRARFCSVAVDNDASGRGGHAGASSTCSSTTARCSGSSRDAALKGVKAGRVVRQRDAAAQRLGVGAELSRGRRGRGRGERTGRARSTCSGRRSRSAAQPHGTFKFLFNGIYGGGERIALVGVSRDESLSVRGLRRGRGRNCRGRACSAQHASRISTVKSLTIGGARRLQPRSAVRS